MSVGRRNYDCDHLVDQPAGGRAVEAVGPSAAPAARAHGPAAPEAPATSGTRQAPSEKPCPSCPWLPGAGHEFSLALIESLMRGAWFCCHGRGGGDCIGAKIRREHWKRILT